MMTDEELRDAAREIYGDDDIQIDDDAKISNENPEKDGGAWVQAWVWVPLDE